MCSAELRTELCNFCHYAFIWRESVSAPGAVILAGNKAAETD